MCGSRDGFLRHNIHLDVLESCAREAHVATMDLDEHNL